MGNCLKPAEEDTDENRENLLASEEGSDEEVHQPDIDIAVRQDRERMHDVVSSLPSSANNHGPSASRDPVLSEEGRVVLADLHEARQWKDQYENPTLEFSYKVNMLFSNCELHLRAQSAENSPRHRWEVDTIVGEILALRNYWGLDLLPLAMRNAFVREKIPVQIMERNFRVDCVQFFEPIVFYGNTPGSDSDLVKLYVFIVSDTDNDQVVIRYYLERSFLFNFYHVLCFFSGNFRGQIKPYGTECPPYWEVREHMIQSVQDHLKSLVSDNPGVGLNPIAATVFPRPRNTGPINV